MLSVAVTSSALSRKTTLPWQHSARLPGMFVLMLINPCHYQWRSGGNYNPQINEGSQVAQQMSQAKWNGMEKSGRENGSFGHPLKLNPGRFGAGKRKSFFMQCIVKRMELVASPKESWALQFTPYRATIPSTNYSHQDYLGESSVIWMQGVFASLSPLFLSQTPEEAENKSLPYEIGFRYWNYPHTTAITPKHTHFVQSLLTGLVFRILWSCSNLSTTDPS